MTRRLIAWLTAATVLFWLGAAGFGAYVMREEFNEVFDSALEETAQRLMPLVVDELSQSEDDDEPREIDSGGFPEHEEYLTYQVRDRAGNVLLRSHDAGIGPFDAPLAAGFFDTPHQRLYTAATADGAIFLQVADPLEHRTEAMAEGALALVLPLLALAPLSVLAIWLIVRQALSPIASLRQEIGERNGVNLAPLLPGSLPVELAGIATSVDLLLGRLRAAIEAERHFAANSAHELRTPIAGALAQTQRLIAELPEGPAQARARQIESALRALGNLSQKLLQLSRAEAGIGAAAAASDLVPILRLVVDEFQGTGREGGRIVTHITDGATLVRAVDVDAFAIVVRNLIENALVHGSPAGPVAVSLDKSGNVVVVNDGPIIPADRLDSLKTRFQRGEGNAEGSGLGLAIAETLIGQMGGRLELHSPATAGASGFEARMIF